MSVPSATQKPLLDRLKNALQNADLAYIGQWPRLLRIFTLAFVSAGLFYFLWVSQLEAAYQNHEMLAEQVSIVKQDLKSLQTRPKTSAKGVSTVGERVPESALEHLHQMLKANKIQLVSIQQSPLDKSSNTSKTTNTNTKPPMKWTVELQSSYAVWRAWMGSLASQSWLWDITQFELRRKGVYGNDIGLQIRMTMVDAGSRRFASLQKSDVLQNFVAHSASVDSQYLFGRVKSKPKTEPKSMSEPSTLGSASALEGGADVDLLLLGTVLLSQTTQNPDGGTANLTAYQAVIRQGQQIHLLEQGQTFLEKNSAKQWRLEAVSARSALLRDTQSTLSKSLVLGKPKQNTQNQMPLGGVP